MSEAIPSSATIKSTLRGALPPHLHHLVDPLTRYLEAAATLRDLLDDPATGTAVVQAMTSLQGTDIPLAAGVINFGTGNNLGDVTMRDVAGRDIVNIALTFPVTQPNIQPPDHGLYEEQLRLLQAVAVWPRNTRLDLETLASQSGLEEDEVDDQLQFLEDRGWLRMEWYIGAILGRPTFAARRLLRSLERPAS